MDEFQTLGKLKPQNGDRVKKGHTTVKMSILFSSVCRKMQQKQRLTKSFFTKNKKSVNYFLIREMPLSLP